MTVREQVLPLRDQDALQRYFSVPVRVTVSVTVREQVLALRDQPDEHRYTKLP